MNCDQVFDVLTRGPFPTGDLSDRAVEAHLSHCVECHRLAEALRPAVELFEESIPVHEGRDLPGYWGELRPAPVGGRAAKQIQVVRRPPAAPTPVVVAPLPLWHQAWARPVWRVTAAVALGVVLAVALRAAGLSERPAIWETAAAAPLPASPKQAAEASPPLQAESPLRVLPALQLAPACFGIQPLFVGNPQATIEVAQGRSLVDYNRLQCCTQCHHQGHANSAPHAIASVAQSCANCHQ